MLLRKFQSPKMAIPVGVSIVSGGFLLITLSIALPRLGPDMLPHFQQYGDFLRGFLIGLGIVMEIAGLGTMLPALYAKRQRPSAPGE